MAEKVRTTVTMDASTKEQFDKFKEAGIDLNMSEILSSILRFDFNSIETFIDCMKKIHGPDKNFTRFSVRNGMLVIGDVDKARLTQYILQAKLGRPELLEAVMMSKVRRNRTIPIEERLENLEKLVLRHNASIDAIEDYVQKHKIDEEIEVVKQVSQEQDNSKG
jgi:hypothetical protein